MGKSLGILRSKLSLAGDNQVSLRRISGFKSLGIPRSKLSLAGDNQVGLRRILGFRTWYALAAMFSNVTTAMRPRHRRQLRLLATTLLLAAQFQSSSAWTLTRKFTSARLRCRLLGS